MSFKKLQEDVERWTSQWEPQYWEPHEIMARIAEETGEIGREINHVYGPKQKKDEQKHNLGEEISDLIFALICLANSENIDLDTEWQKMMEKYDERDEDRFDKA